MNLQSQLIRFKAMALKLSVVTKSDALEKRTVWVHSRKNSTRRRDAMRVGGRSLTDRGQNSGGSLTDV